ncbi:hypothetical protein GCM10018962_37580 [Dactylosporangium matsuzakiense]
MHEVGQAGAVGLGLRVGRAHHDEHRGDVVAVVVVLQQPLAVGGDVRAPRVDEQHHDVVELLGHLHPVGEPVDTGEHRLEAVLRGDLLGVLPQRLRLCGAERRPLQGVGAVIAVVAVDRLGLGPGRRGHHEVDHLAGAEPGRDQLAGVVGPGHRAVERALEAVEVQVERAQRRRWRASRGDDVLGDRRQEVDVRVVHPL